MERKFSYRHWDFSPFAFEIRTLHSPEWEIRALRQKTNWVAGIQLTTTSQGKEPIQRGPASHLSAPPRHGSPPRSDPRRLVLCSQQLWGWQVKKFHRGRGNEIESKLQVICLPCDPQQSRVIAQVTMLSSHLWVNYWLPAFKNRSDVLGLKRLKRIEQRGKGRGNQAPLGILFESTKRLDWNLQSIYKEAVKSFIHLNGAGKETQEVRQERLSWSMEKKEERWETTL